MLSRVTSLCSHTLLVVVAAGICALLYSIVHLSTADGAERDLGPSSHWAVPAADVTAGTVQTLQQMFSEVYTRSRDPTASGKTIATSELRALNEAALKPKSYASSHVQPYRAVQYFRMSPGCPKNTDSITTAFATSSFVQTTEASGALRSVWDTYWVCAGRADDIVATLQRGQTVNVFPSVVNITTIKTNLCESQRRFWGAETVEHMMPCFSLPAHTHELEQFTRTPSNQAAVLLSKPANSCCGRGMELIPVERVNLDNLTAYSYMQVYLTSPHLINGRKYDFRIFTFVSSVAPLRVFVSTMGFARISVAEYTDPHQSMNELFRHITNVHFQNKNDNYLTVNNSRNDMAGSQWSLAAVMALIETEASSPGAAKRAFHSMRAAIARTLMAVTSQLGSPACAGCYQMLGADVILDSKLNAYVLELNSAAALSLGNPMVDGHMFPDILPDMWRMRGVDRTVWQCNVVLLRAWLTTHELLSKISLTPTSDGEALVDDLHTLCNMLQEYYYRGNFVQAFPEVATLSTQDPHVLKLPRSELYDIYLHVLAEIDLASLFEAREPFFV